MRYSKEFIEEVVQCYLRVDNKSYVSRKYKLNLHTVRYWVNQYEKEKNIDVYAKKLSKMSEILNFYEQTGDYNLVAEKYDINKEKVKELLDEYKTELHFLSPNYKKLKRELMRLLDIFSEAYDRSKSIFVLEKVILIELCLGKDDDYIISKYNPSLTLLDKVKKTL
ncbi:MAG: transposase [Acinetobacter sp.]|nr:transposase [Acinetobacter sp.]